MISPNSLDPVGFNTTRTPRRRGFVQGPALVGGKPSAFGPFGSDKPVLEMVPVDRPRFGVFLAAGKALAFVLPRNLDQGQMELLYAIAPEPDWAASVGLAKRWKFWAVLCSPDWAEIQLSRVETTPAPQIGHWLYML